MPTTKSDTWNPHLYHSFQKERSEPFFDLMGLIKKEGFHFRHALDLGCGTGELTKILQDTLEIKEVVGVDSSIAMLNKAKEHEDANLKFKHQSIEEALQKAAPESQDLIFSNASLHWCDDHASLITQMFRAIHKGGQLAIQVPANHDYPTHIIAKELGDSERYAPLMKIKSHENSVLEANEYAQLLFEAGFKEQHVRLQVYPHHLKSREEVVEWVKGTLLTHYERALGPEQYALYLKDYQELLFRVLPDQKPFFYPFKRLHIWARK